VAGVLVRFQQIEGFADAGQHPEAKHIDLEDLQRVDVVLVPFDAGARLHRRILDRAQLVQPALGDDETADMLRQVARKADDLSDERDGAGKAAVVRVQAKFANPRRIRTAV